MTCCANDGIAAILNPVGVSEEYVCHFFNSQTQRLRDVVATGNGQPNLNTDLIKGILFPKPPIEEQERIAAALSSVDELLEALDKLIAKKRDMKTAAMQQLLTGKTRLPGFGEGVGMKQTELGEIPADWSIKYLGEIGDFKNGINKGSEDFGFGSPFVNLMDVFGVQSIRSSTHLGLVNSNSSEQQTYDLRKGDVLFIRSSVKPEGVGLTTLIEGDLPEVVYSGFIIRFRDYGNLNTLFKRFCFYENNFRSRVIASSTVSANTNINQDNLKRLQLGFPSSVQEQKLIGEFLLGMEQEITALEAERAKTQAIKQGMMQELLTGRTRLL